MAKDLQLIEDGRGNCHACQLPTGKGQPGGFTNVCFGELSKRDVVTTAYEFMVLHKVTKTDVQDAHDSLGFKDGGDQLQWDDAVMIQNLQVRSDLNDRAARVISGTGRKDGRIPVEMFCGQKRLWIKPRNLIRIPPCLECLTEEPFVEMPNCDTTELAMFFMANKGSVRVPGLPMRLMPLRTMAPTEETPESAPTPSAPPSPPSSPHGSRCPSKNDGNKPVKDHSTTACASVPTDISRQVQEEVAWQRNGRPRYLKLATDNLEAVLRDKAGARCYHCLARPTVNLRTLITDQSTVVCPCCGVDSVVPASEVPDEPTLHAWRYLAFCTQASHRRSPLVLPRADSCHGHCNPGH